MSSSAVPQTNISYTLSGLSIVPSTVTASKRAYYGKVNTRFIPVSLGTQTLTACIDQENLIIESNERNNCMSTTFMVEEALPDLTIINTSIEPNYPNLIVDETVQFSSSVYNQGTLQSENFDAVLYIDINNDNTRDVSEIIPVTNLGISEETTLEYLWTAPLTDERYQTHAFFFCADPYDLITESNEDNNCSIPNEFTTEMGPDLAVGDVRYTPDIPLIEQVITFTATVSNIGIGPSDSGLDIALAVDTDNDYTLEDGNSWEVIIQDAIEIEGGLNPGESQEFSLRWTSFVEQEYHYIICLGEGKSEGEINRANNCSEVNTFEVVAEDK